MTKLKSVFTLLILIAVSVGASGCSEGCKDCQSMLEDKKITKLA